MSQQQQYLKAMGITVWQRRNLPLPDGVDTQKTDDTVVTEKQISTDTTQLTWPQLEAAIVDCPLCPQNHSQLRSFGFGGLTPDVMFIATGTSEQSTSQHYCFEGQAKRLFNNILRSLSLPPQKFYITTMVKCCSGEKEPSEAVISHCKVYLQQQIVRLKPKVIVVLGEPTLQTLQQHFDLPEGKILCCGDEKIPLIIIHSPEHLLQNPLDKREVWQNLQRLQQLLKSL